MIKNIFQHENQDLKESELFAVKINNKEEMLAATEDQENSSHKTKRLTSMKLTCFPDTYLKR
jgi:hypothetical protein